MKKTLLIAGLSVIACSCAPMDDNYRHGDRNDKYTRMADYYFDMADTNDDGVITRREFDSLGRTKFNNADVNDDNVITRDELRDEKIREMRDYKAANGYDYYKYRNGTRN